MKKRLAAEWEPIKGVMIAWPAFLPHAYIVDLTQNYHVYLCVPGQDEENNAKKHLTEWGGNIRNVTFCQGPQGFDAPWVRDWGMHPIFDESRNFHLAGAEYQMSTPFVAYENPEVITNRTGYTRTGWGTEDVAHCRTRAVWDENMLYIAVRRLEEEEPANQVLDIHVNIVDYSKAGLIEGSLKLYYRDAGGTEWNCQPLETTNDRELFLGSLMGKPGDTIEYYVAAESKSGRKETMPRVAPKGTYKVHIR